MATRGRPKAIKVKAKGPSDTWVGYYDHIRRRGGDVFLVKENAFSSKWMEKVTPDVPETKPKHFNKFGRGQRRAEEEAKDQAGFNLEDEGGEAQPEAEAGQASDDKDVL